MGNSKSITVIARSVVLNKAKLINTIYLRSESFVKVGTFGTTVHGLRSLKDDLIKTSKRTSIKETVTSSFNASISKGGDSSASSFTFQQRKEKKGTQMICRVVSRGGSKILHLRSSIMIRNQTSLPLLFTIQQDQKNQKKEKKQKQDQKDQKEEESDPENSEEEEKLLWSRVVSPFETVPVPMHLTDRTLLVTPIVIIVKIIFIRS